jgi:hypothetical protein
LGTRSGEEMRVWRLRRRERWEGWMDGATYTGGIRASQLGF